MRLTVKVQYIWYGMIPGNNHPSWIAYGYRDDELYMDWLHNFVHTSREVIGDSKFVIGHNMEAYSVNDPIWDKIRIFLLDRLEELKNYDVNGIPKCSRFVALLEE